MYACSTVDVLYLTPPECGSGELFWPPIIDHLRGKVIAYSDGQSTNGIVQCDLAIKLSDGKECCFCAQFKVTSSTAIVGPYSAGAVVVSSNCGPLDLMLGSKVRDSTRIVLLKTAYDCVPLAGAEAACDRNMKLFESLTPELQATLVGCARSCFHTDPMGEDGARASRVASLLLLGQSGSGCASAVRALALRSGARLSTVRVEQLYESGKPSLTREWGRRAIVRRLLQGIAQPGPCILLLEDLHFLARRTGAEAASPARTDAEEGVVEGLVHAIASLRRLAGSDTQLPASRHVPTRLLIVGCVYEDSLLDQAVLEAFEERVDFPLPSAVQRRALCVAAWRGAQAGSEGRAPPALNQFADSLAGISLIPLLLRAEDFAKQLAGLAARPADTTLYADSFRGVAGLEDVKQALVETVLWPRRFPHLYRSFARTGSASRSLDLPTGLLLFGPPGTGKTLLPRALSEELGCALVVMRLSEVVRGEVGTSERRVRSLFQEAKQAAPSIVFIDEFQALFTSRGRSEGADGGKSEVGSTLSAALAGCFDDLASWNRNAGPESMVTVVAATNEPWAVDSGFLRPGRLGKCLLVGPLDVSGRAAYVRNSLGAGPAVNAIAETVAQRTEGYSGADLTLLCARAAQICAESPGGAAPSLREFERALQCTAASTSAEDMEEYRHWQAQYPHLAGAPD